VSHTEESVELIVSVALIDARPLIDVVLVVEADVIAIVLVAISLVMVEAADVIAIMLQALRLP
jgi:hypothetical protein